ncbi:DNA pilot protein [Apis mellifera associated microvirus 31]|nr:DNA pilot protein [Apis mellifera associated microvirus 31]
MGINFFGVYPGDPVREKGWIPLAIAAGTAIAGGIMQNNANKQMAADANEATAQQAQYNREWQERMSNTAHQREVADLKAAGLNPILSATGGSGASTPSGNAPTMQAAHMEDVIGKGVSSAKDAYAFELQTKTAEADIALKQASTASQAAQAAQAISTAKNIDRRTINDEAETFRLAEESHTWRSRYRSEKERYEYDRKQTEFDKSALMYDNIAKRAEQATGMVQNVVPAIRLKTDRGNEKMRTEHKQMKTYLQRKGQIER